MSIVDIDELQDAIVGASGGCTLQNGWPCGSCFFSIDTELDNSDWQAVLLVRDPEAEEGQFNNLPADIDASLNKTLRLAKEEIELIERLRAEGE